MQMRAVSLQTLLKSIFRNTKSELSAQQPSRGPDRLIDPIWVETGLKAAEMYLKHRNRVDQAQKAAPPRQEHYSVLS